MADRRSVAINLDQPVGLIRSTGTVPFSACLAQPSSWVNARARRLPYAHTSSKLGAGTKP
jgi:hypothetical protein